MIAGTGSSPLGGADFATICPPELTLAAFVGMSFRRGSLPPGSAGSCKTVAYVLIGLN
jgi:hypothetical protein